MKSRLPLQVAGVRWLPVSVVSLTRIEELVLGKILIGCPQTKNAHGGNCNGACKG